MTHKLLQAAKNGETSVVKDLLERGADINARDAAGRTPVLLAAHGSHIETIHFLIEAGADVNLRDDRNDNPLLHAAAAGKLAIVKLLLDAGADTRLTNRYGGVSLIPASERGHVEVVKELLTRSDVNVNHINNLGWTALLEAIILSDGGEDHQKIVALLIEHGADVELADREGVTPLSHARSRRYQEMERMLVNAGATR
ncbi:ankyrin repeat domain-containing protein [Brevibacillus fluminis]|uniref:Ankyrin repeat domain-containing protein n=1 Tax=Brevibacillus fluminis TaxID=511487 RepID=A0A3M8DTZ1_9BACL|nr:ankyrin repeat domain-containing protein [Brevibacillus fluminis]RNB90437.1 ankyrin repeat domain-containing protein [Brevibacillus fluminis]